MDKKQIKELFGKFGADISADDVWTVQQATVIKHKALERLAAKAGIVWAAPQILRAERDEAVILVTGSLDKKTEWSIGEAVITPMIDTGQKNNWNKPVFEAKDGAIGNYSITPKQAAYPYAMAEKRAKDRVIIKLCGLHGLYSEDEADEFKQGASNEKPAPESQAATDPEQSLNEWLMTFKAQLQRCKTRHDVEMAWKNSAAKRDAFGVQPGDDDFLRMTGFCRDRIEEIGL